MSRRRKRSRTRHQDSLNISTSGMGSSCDKSASVSPVGASLLSGDSQLRPGALDNASPVLLTGPWADNFFFMLYRAQWEARKIVNIRADDMTRAGWDWISKELQPEDIEKLDKREEELRFITEVNMALIYERLYGGGVVYLGVKDAAESAEEPLDVDALSEGDLIFVRSLPRSKIHAAKFENNPLSVDYNRPRIFTIQNERVHRSRLLIFNGKPVQAPNNYSLNYRDGFGESVLIDLYKDIQDAQASRQSAAHLTHTASVPYFKKGKNLLAQAATKGGNKKINDLLDLLSMMSNFKGVLLDKDDELLNYQSSFQSLSDILITQLQVLSAGSDIPATRFLGQSPGGLNATGDSDLRNYYDAVGSDQVLRLKPELVKFGDILSRTTLGRETPDLTIKFNPLFQATEKEQAEIRGLDTTVISTLAMANLLEDDEARKELTERGIILNTLEERPEPDPFDLGLSDIEKDANIRP